MDTVYVVSIIMSEETILDVQPTSQVFAYDKIR